MPHLREHGEGASGEICACLLPPADCAARGRCGIAFAGGAARSIGGADLSAVAIVERAMARADATRRRAADCASGRIR